MKVLLTGCSRGIGAALLELLAKDDSVSIIYACTSSVNLKSNIDKVKALPFNFEDSDSLIHLTSSVTDIDVIINIAGYLKQSSFEETSLRDLNRTFQINFFGPYQLLQLLIPKINKGGQVISIGSMGGVQGSMKFPGLSAYSASKAALAVWTECLAEECKDTGIHFNCLALGAVDTEMLKEAFPGYHAGVTADEMALFIWNFVRYQGHLVNGKVVPVSKATP